MIEMDYMPEDLTFYRIKWQDMYKITTFQKGKSYEAQIYDVEFSGAFYRLFCEFQFRG